MLEARLNCNTLSNDTGGGDYHWSACRQQGLGALSHRRSDPGKEKWYRLVVGHFTSLRYILGKGGHYTLQLNCRD